MTESVGSLSLRERLEQLLAPALTEMGYELICVEHLQGGRQRVRLYIDRPEGIGLEDCEQVSHHAAGLLDVHDPVPGEYVLEVSSPGDDRPLVKPQHFARFVGERVKVRTWAPVAGRRNFLGELVAADAESVQVDVEGTRVTLRLTDIERARLAPQVSTASPRRGSKR